MRSVHRVLAAALPLTLLSVVAVAQARPKGESTVMDAACARGYPATARPVVRAFTQERLAWFRRQYGLTRVKTRELRVLRSAADAQACARLERFYASTIFVRAPYVRSYYGARGIYIASFRDTSSQRRGDPRAAHFAIFDLNHRPIATLSPK